MEFSGTNELEPEEIFEEQLCQLNFRRMRENMYFNQKFKLIARLKAASHHDSYPLRLSFKLAKTRDRNVQSCVDVV